MKPSIADLMHLAKFLNAAFEYECLWEEGSYFEGDEIGRGGEMIIRAEVIDGKFVASIKARRLWARYPNESAPL